MATNCTGPSHLTSNDASCIHLLSLFAILVSAAAHLKMCVTAKKMCSVIFGPVKVIRSIFKVYGSHAQKERREVKGQSSPASVMARTDTLCNFPQAVPSSTLSANETPPVRRLNREAGCMHHACLLRVSHCDRFFWACAAPWLRGQRLHMMYRSICASMPPQTMPRGLR